ncbi:MAG: hypothetical protein EPN47_20935 [Acidobacteria bacterium]|nr:MAG: hypothetical protein EPN47_20935 [Acidobacteriota bacterium]
MKSIERVAHHRRRAPVLFGALLGAGLVAFGLGYSSSALAALQKLSFQCNFSPKELSEWIFPHGEDWASKTEGGQTYLHMLRPLDPGVPRRPLQFARIKNVNVGSFDLSIKVRREGSSMIIVFNYVDTLHFYYTHISRDRGTAQPVHNGIFLVDGAPRRRIAGTEAQPALPDMKWHTIRVVRNVKSGLIQVYSDVQQTPLFSVIDHHFTCGQIGLGSFDETGDFTDLKIKSSDAGCTPQAPNSPQTLLQQPEIQG